jgi:hypothetical protein
MAKIVDFQRTYLSGDSSYTLSDTLSLSSSSGDLLLLWVAIDGSRTLTTPSGWTQEEGDTSQGIGGYLLSKVTTTDNEALPAITISSTDEVSVVAVSLTGQKTSSPITDITTNRTSNQTATWLSHTTTNSKSLVLYFGAIDNRDIYTPFEVHQFFDEGGSLGDLGNVTATGGWRWQESVGTIPSCAAHNAYNDGWHCISVSILDNTTTPVAPDFFFETWPREGTAISGVTDSYSFADDVEAAPVLLDGSTPLSLTFDAATGPVSIGSSIADSGTGTITGGNEDEALLLTDGTKSWTTDQWKGYSVTWDSETHYIQSNTATTLTTVNSQRVATGSQSYTINDQAGITLDASTTTYVNGRQFVVEANGATLPTGLSDGDHVWVTYIDSTTIGLTDVAENNFYKDGGLNGFFNITASGSGTVTLRELSLIPLAINSSLIVRRETGNGWMGRAEVYTTAIDLTDKIFQYELQTEYKRKIYILLVDDDGDWVSYQVNGQQTINDKVMGLLDVGSSTKKTYEYNTFDLTRLKKAVLLIEKETWKDEADAARSRFSLLSKFEIIGGLSSDKITWQKLSSIFDNYFPGATSSGSSGQFAFFNSLEIGGGGTVDTFFADENKSIALPPESDGVTEFQKYTPATSISWRGSSSSELTAPNHQWYGGAPYSYTIDAGDLSGAEVGGTFIEATFSANSADTYDRDSFSGGNGITPNGADFTNCVFDDVPTITQGASDFTGSTIRNSPSSTSYEWGTGNNDNITVLGTVDFDTAGSYDLVGATITEVTNSSGGAVTLNIDDNTTITTNTGPNITIVDPSALISFTNMGVTGANIRLQIENTTAKSAASWLATTAYVLGDKVLRSTGVGSENIAGLYFVVTTGGTTGGTEPTWDTTVGNTTTDGSVVWTCYSILYHDADPASSSYSSNYFDGQEFTSGDIYSWRFARMNGSTSFAIASGSGVVSSSGFSVIVSEVDDTVYSDNAIDGSNTSVTNKFTADFVNNEIDLDANLDFSGIELYSYYCYELTQPSGMYLFWGGVTAIDTANYRNNVDVVGVFIDETAGFVKQTDSVRWFRSDGQRPIKDPTTGGAGVEMNWRNPVYLQETGVSGLTPGESAILSGLPSDLSTINQGVQNASILVPHTTDL